METDKSSVEITSNKFFKVVKLFVEKPHLTNKRICGTENKWFGIGAADVQTDAAILELIKIFEKKSVDSNISVDHLIKFLGTFGFQNCNKNNDKDNLKEIPWNKDFPIAIIRYVIPKNLDFNQFIMEVVIFDLSLKQVFFVSEVSENSSRHLPEFPYMIQLKQDTIKLNTFKEIDPFTHGFKWLNYSFLPTVSKWAKQMSDEESEAISPSSLRLINVVNYNKTYQDLKKKYSKHLMKIWTETTDPQKFIYEDLGIAAYLINIWEQERLSKGLKEKQSFLDLGCGNGLLVYILASEGYPGLGIDIKKRKLWDVFPEHVHLKVDVILPSDKCLYPAYDWLIGNHSDELTPWLPVIAAKSSFTSKYFLMPCCAFDFQSKFQRLKSGLSQYAEYLDYIEHLGTVCGFDVWKDKLRISSTKRTCFIGQNRTYTSEEWNSMISRINEFVHTRCRSAINKNSPPQEDWCDNFKPREAVQVTRNCTRISPEIKSKLINYTGFLLLNQENLIEVTRGNDKILWNKGGPYSFKEWANTFGKEELKELKNECGGLQTLLRNHKYIFKIENGDISLKIPEPLVQNSVKTDLVKTKACWFHAHHPQGCTLLEEDCAYIHAC